MTEIVTKICSICGIEKSILDFTKGKGACKKCCSEKTKKYNREHKEERNNYGKKYHKEHKEEIKEKDARRYVSNKTHINEVHNIWMENNKDYIKEYGKSFRENNKEYFANYIREYERNRKKNDPVFKIRKEISVKIVTALKSNGSTKNGKSILDFLPYTIQELKEYLEKQFKPWMTWKNWGKYDPKTWDDNDSSTWTWNIDHIIPHSTLPYSSMEEDNFLKCWALSNLRPLSAKQNLLDGASRIRHKGITQ